MSGDNHDNSECDAAEEADDDEGPEAGQFYGESSNPDGRMKGSNPCLTTEQRTDMKRDRQAQWEYMTGIPGTKHELGELELEVIVQELDEELSPQYVSIAASQIALQEVDADGNDVHDPNDLLSDGYLFVGKRSHKDMEACGFIVTDRLKRSYITTAALRRSGCHPEKVDTTITSRDGDAAMEPAHLDTR